MKRIAIISEFNRTSVNYGNRLQAMALNRYLNKVFPEYEITYLYFSFWDHFLVTKKRTISERLSGYVKSIQKRVYHFTKHDEDIDKRRGLCDLFSQKYMTLAPKAYTWEKLLNSDFDTFIIGSDVVWAQGNGKLGQLRFLDFNTKKCFDRISYAASFGRDWIPDENIEEIKRCLGKFKAISVRENSSVKLLEKYNIKAVHTVDPTLLLDKAEWQSYERQPSEENLQKCNGYVFTYLLGVDKEMRNSITVWAKLHNLLIITVPYAVGEKNGVDKNYGDIKITECSPENWLWLIDHAEYVITDSFHGSVFSTIFEKKLIVMNRVGEIDINNRMIDFMVMIKQTDKIIPYSSLSLIDKLEWDYFAINDLLEEEKNQSKRFLVNCLK